ncbi:DNA (cytosine-5)-methyltransferase CMT2 isoform X2 [Momordica charantia]|uniref:Cytosine-specific methyltransferase n=1 Tax=Momordica charantia TaxID=3673 RepID=A0A6J1CU58_MOMCH|nr:DNA (cytosine-5)-methyltransferase CMT2 isoform X2 [Momordica charantia]
MRSPLKSRSKSDSISKSKSTSKFRSLPIVSHGNVTADHTPVPLAVFDPKMSRETCLRRSPRLCPSPVHVRLQNVGRNRVTRTRSESASAPPGLRLGLLVNETLMRRSPRLHPALATGSVDETGNLPLIKKCRMLLLMDANDLRRSPRFNGSGTGSSKGEPELSTKTASKKRKSSISESADAKFLRRSPRFDSVKSDERECGLNQGEKATSQCLTYKEEKDEVVKNLEGMEQKAIRRSPRFSSNELENEIRCHISSSKKSSSRKLASLKKDSVDALSLTVYNAETDSSRKLDAEQLSCSKHEEIYEATVSTRSETSNFGVELSHKMEAEPSPVSLSKNYEEEPELFCGNSYFIGGRLLRRSPRLFSDYKDSFNCNVNYCTGFNMKNDKPLSRSPGQSLSSCGNEQSKSLDNQTSKMRHSPQVSIFACGDENSKIRRSYSEFLESGVKYPPGKIRNATCVKKEKKKSKTAIFFVGDPVPADEAQQRWKWRYEMKSQISKGQRMTESDDDEDMIVVNVDCHYTQASIANTIFSLGDCVYIKGEGENDHVGRIIEFFKTTDGDNYFRGQWFYRVEDTVIQEEGAFHDRRRLFYSTVMNDNPLDCIVSKVNITRIKPRVGKKLNCASSFDFYYDMEYCVDYSTFRTLKDDESHKNIDPTPTTTTATSHVPSSKNSLENIPKKADLELLDLFSGCGGMSTGLCLGAKYSSVGLITRWAVDSRKSACESFKLNHPETHVRNETAEDFLDLLKEWEKLCRRYKANDAERTRESRSKLSDDKLKSLDDKLPTSEFEVSRVVDICYGDPTRSGKRGLKFMVHWKGYGPSEDTWEPVEGLSNCQEAIKDFVNRGLRLKILPLPGDVDVICGGPPCQGISGYNRFRNIDCPMDDERNRQIVMFMDIVKFLRPKFVLMENVTDILRFNQASLGRYAMSRLVHMNYQARLGTIAAGCYGLPQFRLRVFLWGAHPSEKLPQFPLPTHEVIVRYWPPPEFERNTVAYDEDQPRELEKALLLQDAISDLPAVLNSESREKMSYEKPPETEFQRYIRSSEYEMTGCETNSTKDSLYDHRPHLLSEDDYLRVCNIPKRKGANFRDLPGVVVGSDNVARRDAGNEVLLPSGKSMVPDYAFTFEQGKSRRPFGRLWWDETVATVVTFPSCHNQVALHPEQDRVLTIREYARLQGFPDYYRFSGTVKERYCQVGNAVAVSVSRALGYSLGLAVRRIGGDEPLMVLPPKFSLSNYIQFQNPPDNDTLVSSSFL